MAKGIYAKQYIEDLHKALHNLCGTTPDTLKVALMDTSFTFDPATADDWVNTHEITSAGGYTAGGIALEDVDVAYVEETLEVADVLYNIGKISITCSNNPTWTATGDDMDEVGAAIIYNSTTSKVIMYIDFEGLTYITLEDKMFQVNLSNGISAAKIILSTV
jgi:hypothetical protein